MIFKARILNRSKEIVVCIVWPVLRVIGGDHGEVVLEGSWIHGKELRLQGVRRPGRVKSGPRDRWNPPSVAGTGLMYLA